MVLLEQAERLLRRTLTRRITIPIRVMAIRLSKTTTMTAATRQKQTITGFKTITARIPRPATVFHPLRILRGQSIITPPSKTITRILMRHRIIMPAHPVRILIRQ
jgi:hypothetical protein